MKQNRIAIALRSVIPCLARLLRTSEHQISKFWRWGFPRGKREPFVKHLRRHLLAIIVISLVVAGLFHLGWFQGFHSMALDSMLIMRKPTPSDSVVIVTIDDDEFASEDLFAGTSPLSPGRLGDILEAIAAGKPRVIGVDLDTSTSTLSAEYQELAARCRDKNWPPVVWSCDGLEVEGHQGGGHGVPPLMLIPPLGGDQSALTGLVTLPCDPDGVVRRYRRTFYLHHGEDGRRELFDSFPWAIVKEYRRVPSTLDKGPLIRAHEIHHADNHPEPHDLIMNFAGDRFSFDKVTARTVLESHQNRSWWPEKSPLRDRIVLVGGTYRQARDIYATPTGRVPGVELLARATETELRGGGIRVTHEALAILVDILFGIFFVYLNWRFDTPYAIIVNPLIIGVLAALGSLLVFNTFGFWLSFAVVLVGIWLHGLLDVAREMPRLHREVHELRHRLSEYELQSRSIEHRTVVDVS